MSEGSDGGAHKSAAGITVMFVHAHPDDETTKAGGTSAWLAARGARTVLVCCTDGAAGDVTDHALLQGRPLASVRADELAASVAILGFDAVHQLGFADSGSDGEVVGGFASVPIGEPVERLTALIELEQPDVVVTYDPVYAVAHPDHLRCHDITALAFARAATVPHGPRKLYGTRTYSRERLQMTDTWLREHGRRSPYRKAIDNTAPENFTTRVHVGEHLLTARQALREHRTQVPHDHPWFYSVPDEALRDVYPWEEFELLAVHPDFSPQPLPESDILAGLL